MDFELDVEHQMLKDSIKIEKMGHRGSPAGEIILEDCRVPAGNVVGGMNQGIKVMMSGLDIERAVVSGEAVGIAQAGSRGSESHPLRQTIS